MKPNLLVVDDEPVVLDLVSGSFAPDRYQVFRATRGQEALDILENEAIDLVILDYSLPDICGADLFQQIHAGNSELPVIFLTGHANLETAVALMKGGARDYLTKPFSMVELHAHVSKILQPGDSSAHLRGQKSRLPSGARPSNGYLFGGSEAMRVVEAHVQNLPRYPDTTVLITGPTGTGKSAVARRIHELTWGNRAPFVEIDCSTIPHELCESELFGHEKGAFTGAHRSKQGLFETAGPGTAFLDEIGELDLPLQTKLLRVLEARHFKRVGGHATLPMAARVIAATNRSLPELMRAGRFREDLYFRLNVFELWMPPLKDRGDDRIMLAQHFLKYFATHHKKSIKGFTPEALGFIRHCDFPGNVRELRNMVERAVINCDSHLVHFAQLVSLGRPSLPPPKAAMTVETVIPFGLTPGAERGISPVSTTYNLAALEHQKLLEALATAHGNKSKAAKLVGLSRTAFHRRLQKHEVAIGEQPGGVFPLGSQGESAANLRGGTAG